MIEFFNTLTRKKEQFTPLNDTRVTLYTCGPTVYNYLTVGNWVAYIRWDTLVRTLQTSGYEVIRVMNITDVGHLVSDADDGEDKMQKGARREGKSAWEIANMYTENFFDGMQKLNLIKPIITKATDYIPEQLELVRTLNHKGYTYQIDDGIYFDTSKFTKYATFANLKLDDLKEGARVEQNVQKRNTSDFALWKFSPQGDKRDMEWETPMDILTDVTPRMGFPGWHLECSAMAMKKLGETIDIHTGGIDHIPVHHTNEIAQSEAATDKTFAKYWLHNNFLLIDGTKISKSLGNTYTLNDLAEKGFTPIDFRLFILQSHYRTESNFTWNNLQAAKNRLRNWQNVADLRWQPRSTDITSQETEELKNIIKELEYNILQSLQDDLNTPIALKFIDKTFHIIESQGLSIDAIEVFNKLLQSIFDMLGIDLKQADVTDDIKDILERRKQARDNKNWNETDRLRDEALSHGIFLKDTPFGQIWQRS